MESVLIFYNIFTVFQTVVAAVMCLYGYKWSRGLIATVASYIGIGLGLFAMALGLEMGVKELFCLIIFAVIAIGFVVLAYEWALLNHFLVGFIIATKLTFMILLQMAKISGDINSSILVLPIIMGFVLGIVLVVKMNNKVLLICVAYIGATEFVPKIMSFLNKTAFAVTGDGGYLISTDPIELILSFLGIEIPSLFECILVIVLFFGGYFWQKRCVEMQGIVLDGSELVDDR